MDEYIDVTKVLQFNREFLDYLRKHSVTATRLDKGAYPFDGGIRMHPFYPAIKIRKDDRYTSFLGIGCGHGCDVRQVRLSGMKKVKGIDKYLARIDEGFKIFQDRDFMKKNFTIANALSLHDYFLPESFDYVYSSWLINKLDDHGIEKLLRGVYLVLRQDGTFFGRTPENGNEFNISSGELKKYLYETGFDEIHTENHPHFDGKNILYFHCHKL